MIDGPSIEDDLLDRIGFTAAQLPHPVEFLTVELAATAADVSTTTVDSAVANADAFRALTLEVAIRSVATAPDANVWEALQRAVVIKSVDHSIAEVVSARSRQLAADPAFPYLLSGFARLDDDRIVAAVDSVLRGLIMELWPFLQTVGSATGRPATSLPSDGQVFAWLLGLLADALRLALLPDERPAANKAFSKIIAGLMVADLDDPAPVEPLVGLLPDDQPHSCPLPVRGLAVDAVHAGAEILRLNTIHPATSLTVAEIARRCQLSTSGFYRIFGSIVEFERQTLERVGTSLADGFEHHFFEDNLTELEHADPDSVSQEDSSFANYYQQTASYHRGNAANGRPGIELVPWLGSPVLGPIIRRSFQRRFEQRGEFFERLMSATGVQATHGLTPSEVASFMSLTSVIVELLLRNAPDRDQAERFLEARSSSFFAAIFEPSGC